MALPRLTAKNLSIHNQKIDSTLESSQRTPIDLVDTGMVQSHSANLHRIIAELLVDAATNFKPQDFNEKLYELKTLLNNPKSEENIDVNYLNAISELIDQLYKEYGSSAVNPKNWFQSSKENLGLCLNKVKSKLDEIRALNLSDNAMDTGPVGRFHYGTALGEAMNKYQGTL